MSRLIPLVVTLAGALLAQLVVTAPGATAPPGVPAAAPPWRWPVAGVVVRPFSYSRSQPFARGARRGVDLRVARGAAVRAPCGGVVTFAGVVPARGRGVTIRCGRLRATVLGLRTTAVRRGTRVRAGGWVGFAAGPTLRLGAREHANRFGYVDPLGLLRAGPPAAPPGAVPLGRAPRPDPPAGRPTAAPPHAPASRRRYAQPHPAPPAIAYAAIALLAAATGTGELARRRRARHEAVPSARDPVLAKRV